MDQLLTVFGRTLLFYLFLLLVIRLMGKHNLGRLSPFDFVVAIMLAESAVISIERPEISIWHGLVPILTLMGLEIGLSFWSLKSRRLRGLLNGAPTVVIRDGQIVETELRRLRYNLHEMLQELRLNGVPNVADVDYAIWEPSGQLSVIVKPARRPVQPSDLGLSVPKEGLPISLIEDGVIDADALNSVDLDPSRLERIVRERGGTRVADVLLASLDATGRLFIQLKASQGGQRLMLHLPRSGAGDGRERSRAGGREARIG